MASEWPLVVLGDVAKIKHGFAFKGEYFTDEVQPILLVTPGNFAVGGGFQTGKPKYYAGPIPGDYVLSKDDLIVTMTDLSKASDTLGYAAKVPETPGVTYLHNQRIGLVQVADESLVIKGWLHYLMRTNEYRAWVVGSASGTTVKHTSPSRIQSYSFRVPPLEEQRAAASLLDAIEGRIESLRKTNATLEAIAQALFKSWFVDFDPVHARAEGCEPEGMDAATATLFPSEFEDSEIGPIPKGWLVTKLSNLCAKIQNGGTPSRSNPAFWEGGEIPWFKTGELSDGFLMNPSERITRMALDKTSVKVLPKHSVLMAIYAAPTVGRLGVLSQESAFNQACTGMVAKDKVGPWFLFHTLKQGRDWYNDRANGAAQQNISKAIVEDLPCVQPQQPALDAFTDVAQEIYGSIEENSRRAITLSTLRDTLLPRLISGKLRLPDAAREIEAATA